MDAQPTKAASELQPGDRIAAAILPCNEAGDVVFVETFANERTRELWTFVAYRQDRFGPHSERWRADARVPVEPGTCASPGRTAPDPGH